MMNRRHFLRGLGGIAVALPFLESFQPRKARAADPPKRLAIFFCCNGINPGKFWPVTDYGALTAASFAGTGLAPLSDYAPKLLMPRGIHLVPRGWGSDPAGGDDHAKVVGHRLHGRPESRHDRALRIGRLDRPRGRGFDQSGRKGPAQLDGRLPQHRRARQLLVHERRPAGDPVPGSVEGVQGLGERRYGHRQHDRRLRGDAAQERARSGESRSRFAQEQSGDQRGRQEQARHAPDVDPRARDDDELGRPDRLHALPTRACRRSRRSIRRP